MEILSEVSTLADQLSDDVWLRQWCSNLRQAPSSPKVPATACAIATPLILPNWRAALRRYPYQPLAEFFTLGIAQGFRIGYAYGQGTLRSAQRNLDCALQHKEVVDDYL